MSQHRFLFPRWTNQTPIFALIAVAIAGSGAVFGFSWFATNKWFEVGYEPDQPIEYSHKLHAGDLGIDCRYCHSTVERSGFAAVPPTQVCMNCHAKVKATSDKLAPLRDSWQNDTPVQWVKVHNLPDYVYFDHSAHLAAGVGCASCHGRVDKMVRIRQVQPLSMGWCLDCHRDPGKALRPAGVAVTDMTWEAPEVSPDKAIARNGREVHPPTHCSGCHR